MRVQVAIEVEGGLVPVSAPVSYSIVVLKKLKAEPPGQCLPIHPATV